LKSDENEKVYRKVRIFVGASPPARRTFRPVKYGKETVMFLCILRSLLQLLEIVDSASRSVIGTVPVNRDLIEERSPKMKNLMLDKRNALSH
jgi:thiamine biosynthesis protein ThiC